MTPQYALSTYCMSLRPFHSCLRLLPPHIVYITYSLHCLYTDSLVVNTHLNYSHTQSSSAIVLAVPQYIYIRSLLLAVASTVLIYTVMDPFQQQRPCW